MGSPSPEPQSGNFQPIMSILGGVATALVLVTVVIIVTMRYDKIQILPRFFGAVENYKQRIKTTEKTAKIGNFGKNNEIIRT